jgi:O-antigen/teichoic acid export membrane protein
VGRPRLRLRGGSAAGRRRIAAYAGPVVLVDSAFAVFSQLDVLLIGTLLGSLEAGLFQAPLRAVTFLHYPGYAIASAVAPRLAHRDRGDAAERAFAGGLRVTIIVQVALAAALVAWAEPIVSVLLGSEYDESAGVLRAFAPFVVLSGVAPVVGLGANYLGEAGRRLPITIAAVAINLAIDLALLKEIGIVAGVIGSTAAYLLYVPAHLHICRRRVDIDLFPLALTLGRALLAGAVAAGVLALIGTENLSVLDWAAGAIAGPLAYAAVLGLTREVSGDELRELRTHVQALAAERA